jgi:hypothetical protein
VSQPDLFDAEQQGMGPNVAAAHLQALATGPGVSPEVATAVRVMLEERARHLEVVAMTRRVRAAQKRYFAERTQESLTESKELERRLDLMLKE